MARPPKKGSDYFPHDCGMSDNRKVLLLEAAHGIVGYAIWCKILERIYTEGYYVIFTDSEIALFAKRNNVEPSVVLAVINSCMEHRLIEPDLYRKDGVLTSKGIQRRFVRMSGRRIKPKYDPKYWMVEDDPPGAPKPPARFDDFWSVYPRKVGKGEAKSVWESKKLDENADEIIAAVVSQLNEREMRGRYNVFTPEWKHPARWLRRECWTDEITTEEQVRKEASGGRAKKLVAPNKADTDRLRSKLINRKK